MPKSKSTRRGRPAAALSDSAKLFGRLHYRLLVHTNQLRLVSNALNEPASARAEEAAAHVLPTLVRELDALHNDFDHWEMARKQGSKGTQS